MLPLRAASRRRAGDTVRRVRLQARRMRTRVYMHVHTICTCVHVYVGVGSYIIGARLRVTVPHDRYNPGKYFTSKQIDSDIQISYNNIRF